MNQFPEEIHKIFYALIEKNSILEKRKNAYKINASRTTHLGVTSFFQFNDNSKLLISSTRDPQ